MLRIAQTSYPRAWLAINDETADLTAVERASARSLAAGGQTDAPLPDAAARPDSARCARRTREASVPGGRRAADAAAAPARVPRQRADAQELIGLVRERAGQLAHAKAEYEEYLRRYPDGAGCGSGTQSAAGARQRRVRARSRRVNSAARRERATGASPAAERSPTNMARIRSAPGAPVPPAPRSTASLVYGDLLVRDRGERYEFTGRVGQRLHHQPGAEYRRQSGPHHARPTSSSTIGCWV